MSQKQTQQERGRPRETDKSTSSSGNQQRERSPSPANQMQRQVERRQSPRTIDRVDPAYPTRGDPQDHIHFKDGRHALNQDGTWKHGGRSLSRDEKKWITENNWSLQNKMKKRNELLLLLLSSFFHFHPVWTICLYLSLSLKI